MLILKQNNKLVLTAYLDQAGDTIMFLITEEAKKTTHFSQKNLTTLYSNFMFSLYLVYELNNWPQNPSKNFTLKIAYFAKSN